MPFHALKSAARQPAFTFLLVFILAVGIAFVTMVLSLAHSVFLSSVPYGDPDRIVIVWREGPEPIHRREATSYPNIRDWAVGGEPFFEGLAAYTIAPSTLLRHEGAERVMVTYVEPYFFQALDIDMAEGRPLADEDNRAPAGDAVVVLSHGFWQSVLGGDPGIVGTSLNLGGHPHTVVGVMSPRTRWLLREPLEIVTPFRRAAVGMSPSIVEDRGTHSSIVVGRLREGVTVEQAHAGMRVVSRALQDEYPDVNAGIEA
ncbi:MAG TPA: ABC transporter permease, partial [Vicinamibacterales bacterium]|nr:ABC transporter permease [Vicinamibacterales bacterium]